jgi:hypothetical protein
VKLLAEPKGALRISPEIVAPTNLELGSGFFPGQLFKNYSKSFPADPLGAWEFFIPIQIIYRVGPHVIRGVLPPKETCSTLIVRAPFRLVECKRRFRRDSGESTNALKEGRRSPELAVCYSCV